MLWATGDDYVALEVTWLVYQDLIAAYVRPKKSGAKKVMSRVINSIRKDLPAELEELAQLGRTLQRRCEDVTSYFVSARPPARSKPSTDDSSTCGQSPWVSGTSTTTSR